jgi:hypothetical protein
MPCVNQQTDFRLLFATSAAPQTVPAVVGPQPLHLLDQLRRCAQAAGHSATTIETFALWVRHYIVFHAKRHPRELGVADIGRFLADVAAKDKNPWKLWRRPTVPGTFCIAACAPGLGELPLPRQPRLLDQVRQGCACGTMPCAPRSARCNGSKRFVQFHGMRHPRDLGAADIAEFLTHLAVKGHVMR